MFYLAPGNILINYELKKLLSKYDEGVFIEVGAGHGFVSKILLELGWSGHGFDLNSSALGVNSRENNKYINNGAYHVSNKNFLDETFTERVDLVISHMVIEHLSDNELDKYFEKCRSVLNPSGKIVIVVPAGMKYWGVEDEVAGHKKRYELPDIFNMERKYSVCCTYHAFLTYPLSNILLSLSNLLVKKNETTKLIYSDEVKTIDSGHRHVPMKTIFPNWFKFIINEYILSPFIFLQALNLKNKNGLVLMAEFNLRDSDVL